MIAAAWVEQGITYRAGRIFKAASHFLMLSSQAAAAYKHVVDDAWKLVGFAIYLLKLHGFLNARLTALRQNPPRDFLVGRAAMF